MNHLKTYKPPKNVRSLVPYYSAYPENILPDHDNVKQHVLNRYRQCDQLHPKLTEGLHITIKMMSWQVKQEPEAEQRTFTCLEVLTLDASLPALGPSHTFFILPSVDSGKRET